MKITKYHVEQTFLEFLACMGLFQAKNNRDVGRYMLDYDSEMGGYLIYEITSVTAPSTWTPFGTRRLTKQQMFHALQLACNAVEFDRRRR